MTQDDIRHYLGANDAVRIQIAADGDGSPEIAWGDTFFYVLDKNGEPRKMPFATIVTKDYPGFDTESQLDRGGLWRLNIEVGKEKFERLFGFWPRALDEHRGKFDFAALDKVFPHPLYGAHGWASIINPTEPSRGTIVALLDFALNRASSRAAG